jgi:hypothetical protein
MPKRFKLGRRKKAAGHRRPHGAPRANAIAKKGTARAAVEAMAKKDNAAAAQPVAAAGANSAGGSERDANPEVKREQAAEDEAASEERDAIPMFADSEDRNAVPMFAGSEKRNASPDGAQAAEDKAVSEERDASPEVKREEESSEGEEESEREQGGSSSKPPEKRSPRVNYNVLNIVKPTIVTSIHRFALVARKSMGVQPQGGSSSKPHKDYVKPRKVLATSSTPPFAETSRSHFRRSLKLSTDVNTELLKDGLQSQCKTAPTNASNDKTFYFTDVQAPAYAMWKEDCFLLGNVQHLAKPATKLHTRSPVLFYDKFFSTKVAFVWAGDSQVSVLEAKDVYILQGLGS